MRKLFIFLCLSVLTLGLCGCGSAQSSETNGGKEQSMAAFQRVTSDEAAKMMAAEQGYLIVDVRTAGEFAGGHITQPAGGAETRRHGLHEHCRDGRHQGLARRYREIITTDK